MPRGVPRVPGPAEWILTKTCTRCGETKPWAMFSPRRYWPDGSVRVIAAHCQKCDSAWTIARRKQMTPEQREEFNTKLRAYRNAWQRKRRRQLARERNDAETIGLTGTRLNVAPLREFMLRYLRETDQSEEMMAQLIGIDSRVVHRLLREANQVRLHQADRIITRLGGHLDDVYPPDDERIAA